MIYEPWGSLSNLPLHPTTCCSKDFYISYPGPFISGYQTWLCHGITVLLSVACFPLGPNLPQGTCPCKPPLRHALMAVLKVTASGRAWRSHQPSEIGNEDFRYPNHSLAPFQHPHGIYTYGDKDSKNFMASFEVIPTFIQAIFFWTLQVLLIQVRKLEAVSCSTFVGHKKR